MSRIIEIRFNFEMAAGVAPGNVTVVTPVNYMRVRNRTRAYNANAEEQRILWVIRPDNYIVTYTNPRAYMAVIREQNSLLGISYSRRDAVTINQIQTQTVDCFIIKECSRLWQDCKDDPNSLQRGLFISLDKCWKHQPLKYPYSIEDLDDVTDSPSLEPTTLKPTTLKPTTLKPTTTNPTTLKPTTTNPTTLKPTTLKPTTTIPTTIPSNSPSFTPNTQTPSTIPSYTPLSQAPSKSPGYLQTDSQNGNYYPLNQTSADYFYWFFLLAPLILGIVVIFVVYKKKP